jgi:hypothetical protein
MNNLVISSYCIIRKGVVVTRDNRIEFPGFTHDGKFLKEIFKHLTTGYAKFYKMDRLSKLAFLSTEFLLTHGDHKKYQPEEIALIFSNSYSSIDSDIKHQSSIADRKKYFPEPATFVYTLPNIMLGEISIRHNLKGENMFFVSEKFDPALIVDYTSILLNSSRHKACITGWVDYTATELFAVLFFVEPAGHHSNLMKFDTENLEKIMEL